MVVKGDTMFPIGHPTYSSISAPASGRGMRAAARWWWTRWGRRQIRARPGRADRARPPSRGARYDRTPAWTSSTAERRARPGELACPRAAVQYPGVLRSVRREARAADVATGFYARAGLVAGHSPEGAWGSHVARSSAPAPRRRPASPSSRGGRGGGAARRAGRAGGRAHPGSPGGDRLGERDPRRREGVRA